MSNDESQPAESQPAEDAVIVARAGTYYRNARYLMFAIIVAMGIWFMYDGFVRYPRHNAEYAELTKQIEALERISNRSDDQSTKLLQLTQARKERSHHSTMDLNVQRFAGCGLPPVAIGLLAFWLYRSRGEIRIDNDIFSAPGHGDIPLAKIDELDRELWDKKGIAYVYYDRGDGSSARVRLDDFIYQAQPIRLIFDRIEKEIKSQDEVPVVSQPA